MSLMSDFYSLNNQIFPTDTLIEYLIILNPINYINSESKPTVSSITLVVGNFCQLSFFYFQKYDFASLRQFVR